MGWLLAVHVGAGRYGESAASQAQYEALLRDALAEGRRLMALPPAHLRGDEREAATGTAATRVATGVLRVLERSALANCGRGSNLNESGVIECEASVACGRTRRVAACAGVRGVAEPSALALRLLTNATSSDGDSVGREPPLVVVGDGAASLARKWGLETLREDADEETRREYQVTEAAVRQWSKWHAVVGGALTGDENRESRLDTVGAVCVDTEGNTAAALSSGGVLYKVPGRVGLAGCPRMGCDARNVCEKTMNTRVKSRMKRRREGEESRGFAVACTGRGEHFIRSALVPALGARLRAGAEVDGAVRQCFEEAREDNDGVALEGGLLALAVSSMVKKKRRRHDDAAEQEKQAARRHVQLTAALTTPCMGVGYLLDSLEEPRVQILRNQSGQLTTHTSFFSV